MCVCFLFFFLKERKKERNLIPKYLMQIKYVKALELKLEVCIWVTSWPIDSKLSVLVQRLSDCPNTCGPLWRKCAIFICANHGGLSWIWTELESLRLFSFFFFYLLHSIFQPFNYCGWHLIHLCSLKDIYWSKGILQNEYEPAFSIFCLHAFCCPLHRFFSLPLPHLHLFYYFFLFAPLFALCALEWSPCTGMASWGELVKHLLQPLQFCVILASTEPLMLGL